jgi:hypothetical protein
MACNPNVTLDFPTFGCCALALQCAGLTGGGPIATQCLAVLFIGIAIGQPLTGGTKIDIVRADIDEVPPFRLELEVIGFGGVTEMPAS